MLYVVLFGETTAISWPVVGIAVERDGDLSQPQSFRPPRIINNLSASLLA
jgi:hypothetical protein